MTSPVLTRNVEKGRGMFHPFTYSIGLCGTLQEALDAVPDYPLPQPRSDDVMKQFITSLTFLHEALHLAQYTSCSFGLRTLRASLIVLHYLEQGQQWEMPIATKLWQKVVGGHSDDFDHKSLVRILNFLGAAEQLQLKVERPIGAPTRATGAVHVEFVPWTSYFKIPSFAAERDRLRYATMLDGIGVQIHQLPILHLTQSDGTVAVELNAASLMEGYALMFELNSIQNALGQSADVTLADILPTGTEYIAASEYAIRSGACNSSNFVLTAEILTDIALMYDPFVLFNSPTVEKPTAGQVAYKLPGETFLLACEAAKRISPITKYDPDDLRRYYRELCRELDIPSPTEMARKAHEVATTLLQQLPTDPNARMWLGGALAMHAAALEVRLQDPELFPVRLATTSGIFDVLDRCGSYVSFYHIDDGEPTGTFPSAEREREWFENIDLLSLHNLMVESVVEDHTECPLKRGDPFQCPSAIGGTNALCVFKIGGRTVDECLVDVFERRYGLVRKKGPD